MRQAVCIKEYFQACGGNSSVGFDSDRGTPDSGRIQGDLQTPGEGEGVETGIPTLREGRHL